MNKFFNLSILRGGAAAALALAAPLSMAGGNPNVSWSISVGSHAPQVYSPPPQVVYVQPQPVYVRPRPVYVQPPPVIHYGYPYYVQEVRYKKMKRHQRKHHHGSGYHDHEYGGKHRYGH